MDDSASLMLRLATWNIFCGEVPGVPVVDRMAAVAAVLRDIDVACLQEVDRFMAELLRPALPEHTLLCPPPRSNATDPCSHAILYRSKLGEPAFRREPFHHGDNGLCAAVFSFGLVLNMHATPGSKWSGLTEDEYRARSEQRGREYKLAAEWADVSGPVFLLGDFNADLNHAQDFPELAALPRNFLDVLPGPVTETWQNPTRNLLKPGQKKHDRYDAVLVRNADVIDACIIGDLPCVHGFCPSDHYGVMATVNVPIGRAMQLRQGQCDDLP
eukprot:TRINITY_DN42204_c0_g1_i1.p1 TRINITY_DN42204_c0_g1~~TRINITY_DN42204_c0_g1_i1.p1  ORF type:complete len:271 (-),score=38.58 TRINITY_DN42204_c0_g1_i1:10-822(-)